MKVKSWLKNIGVGVVKNWYRYSGLRTQEVVSWVGINGVSWFLVCWYKFRNAGYSRCMKGMLLQEVKWSGQQSQLPHIIFFRSQWLSWPKPWISSSISETKPWSASTPFSTNPLPGLNWAKLKQLSTKLNKIQN